MLIAKQKRQENIAEYVLYMWQLEDIIRAYKLDMSLIEANIVAKFNQPQPVSLQIRQWYKDMVDAMEAEGIQHSGHLMHLKNIVQDLSALNVSLIRDPNQSGYRKIFEEAVPAIHDIVEKSSGNIKNEIDACFSALYGVLMLRLKKKDISPATQDAVAKISHLIAILVKIYHEKETADQ